MHNYTSEQNMRASCLQLALSHFKDAKTVEEIVRHAEKLSDYICHGAVSDEVNEAK